MHRLRELLRDPKNQRIAVIGGAVLLLVIAGALAFSLFARPQDIAEASPSPTPSASEPEPTEAASPVPSPTDPAPTPIPTPSPTPQPMALDQPFAATVLVNDLYVREEPGDGAPTSTLDADDVVLLYGEHEEIDGIDWYGVTASGTTEPTFGWVSAGPDADPYLELHDRLASMMPATVDGMTGSDAGFLAWGFNPRESTEQPTRFVAVSGDGSTWQMTDAPGAVSTAAMVLSAHGPSGWLIVTSNEDHSAPGEIWRSGDGLAWESAELDLPDRVVPDALVGFADGYALAGHDNRSDQTEAALFVSRDGTDWDELTGDPWPYGFGLHSLDDGFIAFGELPNERFIVRTADVDGWTVGEDRGLPGTAAQVVSIGDTVIAVATAPGLGPRHAWRTSLPLGEWERLPELEAILADINISELVASDDWILLAGRAYRDGGEQWWRSADGVVWEQFLPTGASLDDVAGPMAAGAGRFSLVAAERFASGVNPRFATSPDALSWTAATDSAVPAVASSVLGACPAAPATMLAWMAIPSSVGAECFGTSPITFATWHTQGGGCGGFVPGRFEPEWLAHPFATFALVISPMEVPYGDCGSAVVAPGTDVADLQQWVEVTGHWNDPASESCHWIPQRDFPWSGGSGGDLETNCRLKFVATSVVPTSAP